jgi:hypothetical protein
MLTQALPDPKHDTVNGIVYAHREPVTDRDKTCSKW